MRIKKAKKLSFTIQKTVSIMTLVDSWCLGGEETIILVTKTNLISDINIIINAFGSKGYF